jgi:hypothetical protein
VLAPLAVERPEAGVADVLRAAAADPVSLGRRMAGLLSGYQLSAAIGALARLGVADALAKGPLTLPALAARVGADPEALRRTLAALSDVGLFEIVSPACVALTPLGRLLRTDTPGSVRRAAIATTEEWRWRAYGHFTHSLRTGEPGFKVAHGSGFWEYLDRHGDIAEWFNSAMSRISSINAAPLVAQYDFAGIERLVDVGGGHGELVQAVLQAHPAMRGVVYDLPNVVKGAAARLSGTTVADRCETIPGDFFTGVPPGGDAYLLSWVLHDWDDESAIRILRNCQAVLPDGGRVLVIEMIVPVPDDPETTISPTVSRLAKESDLEMLVVVGGRERTLSEYASLLGSADLRLSAVVVLDGLPWSLIEATPR